MTSLGTVGRIKSPLTAVARAIHCVGVQEKEDERIYHHTQSIIYNTRHNIRYTHTQYTIHNTPSTTPSQSFKDIPPDLSVVARDIS